ncbi:393_t:CDS:2, partial [Entrophospora sp. SA101]
IGAYFLPVITSILWLYHHGSPSTELISLSNLLLDLKFMLFLRAFTYFGRYFAIILGVAKNEDYTLDNPDFKDNDPNNPWNLASKYFTYFTSDNSYNQNSIIVQQPDSNTNMFAYFGDSGAFGSWQLQDEPYLAILFVAFSFVVVIYLMNLFIGLLSNQIEKYNIDEAFLAQKAKIIKEIELFYLLPNQRLEDVRRRIREIDSSQEDPEFLPFISEKLRELADMPKPEREIENKLNHNNELLQTLAVEHKNLKDDLLKEIEMSHEILKNHNEQMLIQIQTLLNEIRHSK